MLVSLIIAALSIVYSFIFCSGTFFQMQELCDIRFLDSTNSLTVVEVYFKDADKLFYASQAVSNTMLTLGIILVVIICLNYLAGNGTRRNYYVTNYVATGLAIVMDIVVAIVLIVLVSNCVSILGTMDMAAAQAEYEVTKNGWNYSIWTVPVGYVLAVILIADAVGFGLNLLWKLKLMKGEKALLAQEPAKEVA